MQERLQKILARAGFASRRGAEGLILEGRVTLNGDIVRELGTKADLAADDVRVDGVRVKAPRTGPVYLVLNKPKGVVTTRNDPEGRPTVMSLVPAVAGLFPVGRLDVTTEGLLLLTNDGAFAERVSHPRYEVPRVYHAKVSGVPDDHALERLRRGVRLDDDLVAVDRARVLEADNNSWVEVTLHEGKHHEVRRLLEAVGHPVSKLKRVAFGPVTTKGLEPGGFRALTPEEVDGLRKGIGARILPARIAVRHRAKAKPSPPRDERPRRPGSGTTGRRRPPDERARGGRRFGRGEDGFARRDERRADQGGRPSFARGERRADDGFTRQKPRRFDDDRAGERSFDRQGGGRPFDPAFEKRSVGSFGKKGASGNRGASGKQTRFGKRGASFGVAGAGQRDGRASGRSGVAGPRRGGKPPGPRRGGRR